MIGSKFKVLYFGSDKFSIKVLDELISLKICPFHVATRYRSPLYRFASQKNLEIHQWPIDHTVLTHVNIGLVASFGHLIDVDTIGGLRYGVFNVHPSLLPKYRGSTPIQAAILNGDTETGCTIMNIPPVPKFDIGNIVLQDKLSIKPEEYSLDLSERLAVLGSELSRKLLTNYDDCVKESRPQSNEFRSYAKRIKPEDGLLKFKTDDWSLLERKVRAYTGFIDLYTIWQGSRLKLDGMRSWTEIESYNFDDAVRINLENILNTKIETPQIASGTMFFHKPRQLFAIKCVGGKWLSFDYATPDRRNHSSGLQFYNGYLSKMELLEAQTAV